MLFLRVTSDPTLRGVKTDDGFVIGEVSFDTIFLAFFSAGMGAIGGLFYLGVRGWLPRRSRPLVMGIFGGVVGGAIFIQPGGGDFTLLDPLWLAVSLFIALPAVYGIVMSVLVERLMDERSSLQRSRGWWALTPLPFLVLLGPLGIFVLVALGLSLAVTWKLPAVPQAWRSIPASWLGRAALSGIGVVALVNLLSDAQEIL